MTGRDKGGKGLGKGGAKVRFDYSPVISMNTLMYEHQYRITH